MTDASSIELREHKTLPLPPEGLRVEDADILWRQYHRQVAVDYPSPCTDGKWQLTPRGWVGFLPVSSSLTLRLLPKVPLENIFRMLELAYGLEGFRVLPGLMSCRALEDFYERLAHLLAQRVLARSRRGFCREYVGHRERLPFVRGQIDLVSTLRTPWRTRLACHFEEHTADVEDNRLLCWTLDRIRRNSACRRPEVHRAVRMAFSRVQGVTTPQSFTAADCIDRIYTRLNNDYRVLHGLCRFFLEHTGPTHESGSHQSLPFLVDMAGLFELFVAEWLRQRLPLPVHLVSQRRVPLDVGRRLHFAIDLVLYDRPGGQARAVLDTKYKDSQSPSTDDVAQVVAYAEAEGCTEALLVYPRELERPLELQVGGIRVRTVAFDLDGDLEAAGRDLLATLCEKTCET